VEVAEPTNIGPLVNVEPEETTILVAVAIPNEGVTRVGEVANTLAPEPVSSVSAVANCADVKEPNDVEVLTDVIAPVRLGILVVDDAVPVSAPTNVVAVTTPVTLTSPTTVSFDVGLVVPIPTLESV
jgi:hypothetical protein